ncbi:S8 family serine peptidase, partial [Nocardioides sp. P5_C9_2]
MPLHRHRVHRAGLRRAAVLAVLATVAAGLGSVAVQGTARADDAGVPALQLVTLTGGGTSAGALRPGDLLARQDAVLARVGSPTTTYRWTTALNGFAVELTPDQVAAVQSDPDVASVEANAVRPLTGRRGTALASGQVGQPRAYGGAGVVIGVIDSGLAPESPLFAAIPGLGREPTGFGGTCEVGEDWSVETCNRKVMASGWWVAGFGKDRIRSSEHLSARDAVGHGTQVASVAAGNAGASVRMQGRTVGQYGGIAPQARLAVYKACWGAPDPGDDGCATADLVSAIDRATADGVDVLNVAVAGPPGTDTVERALLGAAEADVVVVAAAGNDGREQYAAHDSPWVTTVGASLGSVWQGRVSVRGGPTLTGASRSRRSSGPTRLVLGRDVAAAGVSRRDAAQCRPGSLDAARTAGVAVYCERGGIGRIDKSDAVARADGVAMVLGNVRPGPVVDDFHAVPTVQLNAPDAARLVRWVRTHDRTSVRMSGIAPSPVAGRTAAWSPPGDPRAG